MRRELLIIGTISLVSVTAFAQQNDNKLSYPQQMQQDLNRAYQTATSEFNKNYTQPQVESNSGKTPVATQPTPPQPVATPPEIQTQQQPVNKIPDVAVSPQNNTGTSSSSSSVGNIYAAGGASQDNSNSDTINPYR